jgi:TonB family protein
MKSARIRLTWWQSVLAVCLLLPVLQPWQSVVPEGTVRIVSAVRAGIPPAHTAHIGWRLFLLAGVLLRLTWFAIGLWRLRRYRGNSELFAQRDGVELRISKTVSSPATFGYLRPVVLLPRTFPSLAPEISEAILSHELLHIKRRDWLRTLAEELICALFWFHPAIWWLIYEIRLAREGVVDLAVISTTGRPEQYIDALLSVATDPPLPAISFLQSRLKQRIISILKEAPMSRTKRTFTLAAGFTLLAVSCWFVTGALPLKAQVEQRPDRIRVGGNVAQTNLISQPVPAYPPEAKRDRIQGTVQLEAIIGKDGHVLDLKVISGPEELVDSAVTAVYQWIYRPTLLNGEPVEVVTIIDINYTLRQ